MADQISSFRKFLKNKKRQARKPKGKGAVKAAVQVAKAAVKEAVKDSRPKRNPRNKKRPNNRKVWRPKGGALAKAQSSANHACMKWKKHMANPFVTDPVTLGDAPNITSLGMSFWRTTLLGTGTEKAYLIAASPVGFCRSAATTNTSPIGIWAYTAGPNWGLTGYYNWTNAALNWNVYATTRPISLAIRVHVRTAMTVKPPMVMGGLMPPGSFNTVESILGTPTGYNVSTARSWVTTKETDSLCFATSWIPLTMSEVEEFTKSSDNTQTFVTPIPYVIIQDIDPNAANASVEVEIISFFEGNPNVGQLAYGIKKNPINYTVMETWNHYVASGKKDFAISNHSNMLSKHSFLYGGAANLSDMGKDAGQILNDNPYTISKPSKSSELDRELQAQIPDYISKPHLKPTIHPPMHLLNDPVVNAINSNGITKGAAEYLASIFQGPNFLTDIGHKIVDSGIISDRYSKHKIHNLVTPGNIVDQYLDEKHSDIDSDFENTSPGLDKIEEDHPLSKSTIDLAIRLKETLKMTDNSVGKRENLK